MSNRKAGRPPLPEEKRRSRLLRVRVTEDEYRTIKTAARTLGFCDSEFVRSVVGSEASRVNSVAERIVDTGRVVRG